MRTVPMSDNKVPHKMLNDKLDATAAVSVTFIAPENSQLQRVWKALGSFLLLILRQNTPLILIGENLR